MERTVNIIILLIIGFVDYLGIGLVYPIFAVLLFDTDQPLFSTEATLELKGAILGCLIATTPLAQFFSSPALGALSDAKGRKYALTIGSSIGCIGYAISILGLYISSLWLLFLYRLLVGVSDATSAVAQASLSDLSSENNKPKLFAYYNSVIGVGLTLGPFIGGMIVDNELLSWFTYSFPLILAWILSSINFFLIVCLFKETKNERCKNKTNIFDYFNITYEILLFKKLKWLFCGGFVLSFGWAIFNEFIPVFLQARFDLSIRHIGVYYGFAGACYAIGSLVSPFFSQRNSSELIVIPFLVIAAGCMLGVIVVSSVYLLFPFVFAMMISLAFVATMATTIISNRTTNDSQGQVLGIFQSLGAAAMGCSPLVVGSAIGAYPELTGLWGAFSLSLSSLCFWKGIKQTQTELHANQTNIMKP